MKKYILIILSIVFIQNVKCQEKKSNIMVFGVPQYLLSHGLRFDVDVRHGESNSWWTFSPYYYFDKESSNSLDVYNNYYEDVHFYKQMSGFGFGVERKTFLGTKDNPAGFYVKFGASYKYHTINRETFGFHDFIGDDGLTYQKLQAWDYDLNINSFSGLAAIGYQIELLPKLYLDAFLGFGIKYSEHNSVDNVNLEYNRNSMDYGYSGTQFIGGFRLGIAL